ncbi:MAG: hypothetical protein KKF44_07025, partial [Nanoarchaeota archaeon]|nr:hypothetical protein [Nanoarchaeota archaeon]
MSLTNSSITTSSFAVNLELNESGNASLYVSTSADFSTMTVYNSLTKKSIHSLVITGLFNNTMYYWKVNGSDSGNNHYSSISYSVITDQMPDSALLPKYSKFDGRTTSFSGVSDINAVDDAVLEILEYGRVKFLGETNMTGLDLDSNLNITFNALSLDTLNLPRLNKSAEIHLYGLTSSNPRILKNGEACSEEICSLISYSGGEIIFNVICFSTYSTEETPVEEDEEPVPIVLAPGRSGGGGGSSSVSATAAEDEEPEITEPILESPEELQQEKQDISNNPEPAIEEAKEAQLEKPAAVGEEKGFNPIYAAVLLSLFVITAILFYFVLFAGKHNKSN